MFKNGRYSTASSFLAFEYRPFYSVWPVKSSRQNSFSGQNDPAHGSSCSVWPVKSSSQKLVLARMTQLMDPPARSSRSSQVVRTPSGQNDPAHGSSSSGRPKAQKFEELWREKMYDVSFSLMCVLNMFFNFAFFSLKVLV